MDKLAKPDIRVLRTKKLITQAILQLITEKPYNQITINDIAKRAMINRNTFYRHFEDKPTLLNQIFSDCIESLKNELDKVSPLTQKDYASLVTWYKIYLDNIVKHKSIFKLSITTSEKAFLYLQEQLHEYLYNSYLGDIEHDPVYANLTANQKRMRAEMLVSTDVGLARYIVLNDNTNITIEDIILSIFDFNYCFLFPQKAHELYSHIHKIIGNNQSK